MEPRRFSFILVSLMLLFAIGSGATQAADGYLLYKIKDGDWPAKVLRSLGLCPLWGNDGSVQVLSKDNQKVVRRNGNLIRPGDILVLPVSSLPPHDDYSVKNRWVQIDRYQPRVEGCRKVEKTQGPPEVELLEPVVDEELAPEPAPAVLAEDEPVDKYFLTVLLLSGWSRIDGTDVSQGGESTLLTDTSLGLGFKFGFFLDKEHRWSLVSGLEGVRQRWKVSSDRTLSNKESDLAEFRVDLGYSILPYLSSIFGVSHGHRVFYLPDTYPSLKMESLLLSAAHLGLKMRWLSTTKMDAYNRLTYTHQAGGSSGSLDVEPGQILHFAFGTVWKSEGSQWGLEIFYESLNQDTQVLKKKETEVTAQLNWGLRF